MFCNQINLFSASIEQLSISDPSEEEEEEVTIVEDASEHVATPNTADQRVKVLAEKLNKSVKHDRDLQLSVRNFIQCGHACDAAVIMI